MFWMLVEWVEWFTSSLNGMKAVQPPEPLENWLNKQNYSLNSMETGQTKHTSKVVLQARPNQPQHESLWYWKQSTLVLVGWVWLARLPCKKNNSFPDCASQLLSTSFYQYMWMKLSSMHRSTSWLHMPAHQPAFWLGVHRIGFKIRLINL